MEKIAIFLETESIYHIKGEKELLCTEPQGDNSMKNRVTRVFSLLFGMGQCQMQMLGDDQRTQGTVHAM